MSEESQKFISVLEPELDIVLWAPSASSIDQISELSRKIFHKTAQKDIHLALINYPTHLLNEKWDYLTKDKKWVTCLRSCLMKPEHVDFVDEIWSIVVDSLEEISS